MPCYQLLLQWWGRRFTAENRGIQLGLRYRQICFKERISVNPIGIIITLKNHEIITGKENNTTDWKHESQSGFQTD